MNYMNILIFLYENLTKFVIKKINEIKIIMRLKKINGKCILKGSAEIHLICFYIKYLNASIVLCIWKKKKEKI